MPLSWILEGNVCETSWLYVVTAAYDVWWLFHVYLKYFDTLSEALSLVDEEAVINPVILIHSGIYRDESLFIDYSATVLGAGIVAAIAVKLS